MEINIGEVIRKVISEGIYSVGRITEVMEIKGGSLTRVYSSPTMQTSMLQKLSKEMRYDFFEVYSKELNLKKPEVIVISDDKKLLAENALEIAALKKEVGYLTQINELLLKKK
jgi:hypothetical protein